MKKFLQLPAIVLVVSLMLISCVKEQLCVNRLANATWEMTEVRLNDVVLTDSTANAYDFTWDFAKYSTVEENSGTFEQTLNAGGVGLATNYEYEITEGCEEFIFGEEGEDEQIASEIIELTKNTFTIEYTENGETTRLTFERM